MVVKSYIERNLRQIDRLYTHSASVQASLFYSKLATLELCGWIEISMDGIVLGLARRLMKAPRNIAYFEKQVVKKVYGFDYDRHFRHMIITLIGIRGVECMEKKIDPAVFLPMLAALAALKPYRDKHAHEYIKGTTLQLDAPSVTIHKFYAVHAGLLHIERVLRKMT